MNRKKIFLIIALMGLSITGITLMQVHWMLKTIKLNEENFDRAVNETIALVVDKLEKEKDIKFSMPFQDSFWYPIEEENPRNRDEERRHYDRRDYSVSKHYSKNRFNNYYGFRRLNRRQEEAHFIDTNENSFAFESTYFDEHEPPEPYSSFTDSTESFETIDILGDSPKITYTTDFNGEVSQTVKVINNDSLSRIIIITNGRYDTIHTKDLPKSLIPPPPPPPTSVDRVRARTQSTPYIVLRSSTSTSRSNYKVIRSDSNNRHRYKESVIALNERQIEAQTKKQQLALKQLVYEMDARKM